MQKGDSTGPAGIVRSMCAKPWAEWQTAGHRKQVITDEFAVQVRKEMSVCGTATTLYCCRLWQSMPLTGSNMLQEKQSRSMRIAPADSVAGLCHGFLRS